MIGGNNSRARTANPTDDRSRQAYSSKLGDAMHDGLDNVRRALAAMTDGDLSSLQFEAETGSQLSPGLPAFLAHACGWELARRAGRQFAVNGPHAAELLQFLAVRQVDAAFAIYPPECALDYETIRVHIAPNSPKEGGPITVCSQVSMTIGSVVTTQTGNRITITVSDNGSDSGPDAPAIIGEYVGPLPAGSYLVDLVIGVTSLHPRGGVIATNVALDAAPPAPIPTLGASAYLLLAGLLAVSGVTLGRRRSSCGR
jgi:hypothetical protein